METVRVVGLYDADAVSASNALVCPEESRTRQEFAEEADINTIISRFGIGENPISPRDWTQNVDLTEAPDTYMGVMDTLNRARDEFMSLPARVRSRFDNSPHEFMNFVSDPANVDEMVSLGLAVKRVSEQVDPALAQRSEGG